MDAIKYLQQGVSPQHWYAKSKNPIIHSTSSVEVSGNKENSVFHCNCFHDSTVIRKLLVIFYFLIDAMK